MDVEYFIENFSFLGNMVTAYKEFNETVTSEQKSTIQSLMTNLRDLGQYNDNHKDIYEKVMRNISLLLNIKYTKTLFRDYCTYLYQWLYLTKKKNKVSDFIIAVLYPASHDKFVLHRGKYECPYFSYDTLFDDPIKIIKLQNFDLDIKNIEKILMDENYSNNLPFKKYICECVNIFKEMYKGKCPYTEEKDKKRKAICDVLNTFQNTYMSYLYIKDGMKDKIPSLYSAEGELLNTCPSDKPETEPKLVSVTRQPSESAPVSQSEGNSPSVEQTNNPIPFNTTSVVSAMAGIPPFLALIYKFTPVGNMFRRKNNKSTNVFENLDEEIEKELFYPRSKYSDRNSSYPTYNVAYGQA
ncbi:PIR protein [Plasmodium vivax]|nr:PIR protein [Plasmodium vivax]